MTATRAKPAHWEIFEMNMNGAWVHRLENGNPNYLDVAMIWYSVALEVIELDARASAWVMALMNLGILFISRTSENRMSNVEHIKLWFEAVLSWILREHRPELEDTLQFKFSGAWRERLAGNGMETFEKSCNRYESAFQGVGLGVRA
jgi:hypothetical protein